MILEETYTLGNGVKIPKVGLGTWLMNNEQAKAAALEALKVGYRHIDTAQAYENEEGVGAAIKESGIARDEIFVTTKIKAETKDPEGAEKSIDESLAKLGLDYIDLLLIHAPEPWAEFRGDNRYVFQNQKVWDVMQKALEAGKVRAIGVANFDEDDLSDLIDRETNPSFKVKPHVNQYLFHPGHNNYTLREYCNQQLIQSEAYSPLGHGVALGLPKVKELAEKYGVTPAQLALRFSLNLGMVVLPKATSPEHIKENAQLDFEISREDEDTLKQIPPVKDYGDANKWPCFKMADPITGWPQGAGDDKDTSPTV